VFNLQGSEIIVILLIALVVLGPERLPDAVRRFMKTYHELRKMSAGFQSEIKSAFDEPMREMRETAQMVRDSVDPSAFLAEAEAEQRLRDEAAAVEAPGEDLPAEDVPAEEVPATGQPGGEVPKVAVPPPPPPLPARVRPQDERNTAADGTRAPT
jgi:sec-independent protein translocase protein TatB